MATHKDNKGGNGNGSIGAGAKTLSLTLLQRFRLDMIVGGQEVKTRDRHVLWGLADKLAFTPEEEKMYVEKMPSSMFNPGGSRVLGDAAMAEDTTRDTELTYSEFTQLDEILTRDFTPKVADRVWLGPLLDQMKN